MVLLDSFLDTLNLSLEGFIVLFLQFGHLREDNIHAICDGFVAVFVHGSASFE